jgi:hypothetical protein
MKKAILIGVLILGFILMAQSTTASSDARFVGTWSGSEKDQQQIGLEKHWIMHRFADGTFILLFTTIEDGEVSSLSEKGKWWTENNEFHELHFVSGATDIYSYTFLDDYHVKFVSKVTIESAQETYEFIDTKLIDN